MGRASGIEIFSEHLSVATNTMSYTHLHNCISRMVTIVYTADATVGNRRVVMKVTDPAGNLIWLGKAGATQPASTTYTYTFQPGIYRETSIIADSLQIPLPGEALWKAGFTVQVYDESNVSASDSMEGNCVGEH